MNEFSEQRLNWFVSGPRGEKKYIGPNILKLKNLANLANKDSLTGLYSRRGFDEMLVKYLKMAQRGKLALCLLVMDLDNLKLVNDTLGHAKGDWVLKSVSKAITLARTQDFFARTGGDEFCGLVFADLEGSQKLSERIKKAFSLETDSLNASLQSSLNLSVGIASFSQVAGWQDENPNELFDKVFEIADRKMYQQKKLQKQNI
jgi:diguanylate cyclase (GGDEF)-like protein